MPISAAESSSRVIINVRELGAIGDGQVHPISEWIDSGKFMNLRAIQKQYPFVDHLSLTIDEVVFEHAKNTLPFPRATHVQLEDNRIIQR